MVLITKHALPVLALNVLIVGFVNAHEHHDEGIPKGSAISSDPIDAILWIHIFLMIASFGIIFPAGMVLGMVRSKWHVPTQIIGTCLAILGWFLGHAHKGRKFAPNIHASFSSSPMVMLALQIVFGVYLKLHIEKGVHGRLRPYAVILHGLLGKAMPLISWIQMLFGGVTAFGFCRGEHLSQCITHFALGSTFIGYGIVMNIVLLAGRSWLRKTRRTQEFWDSLVIAVWGFFVTFTSHWWGTEWSYIDIQYTATGLLWWCGGILGIWLSFGPEGGPRRNIIPALVILLTGLAMSTWQPKDQPVSKIAHAVFGYTLMAAGLTRIIEVTFLLKDRVSLPRGGISSFQYLPPFFILASGFIFQSATEEQLSAVESSTFDEVSYLLVIFSVSFIMFLLSHFLINIYVINRPRSKSKKAVVPVVVRNRDLEQRQIADANEFELEDLVSGEEEEEIRRLVPDTPDPERGSSSNQ